MANRHLFPKDVKSKAPEKNDHVKKGDAADAAPTPEAVRDVSASRGTGSTKKGGRPKKASGPAGKKVSMVSAALQILTAAQEPMSCQALIEAMAARGLWSSPGGKTPANTLSSAFLRLIRRDGKKAAFKKSGRGKFVLNPSASA